MTERTKYILDESEIPTSWYNVVPDLPAPPPAVLHPGTLQPVGPEDLAPLFPMELIRQEVATDSYIDIPAEVLQLAGELGPAGQHHEQRQPVPAGAELGPDHQCLGDFGQLVDHAVDIGTAKPDPVPVEGGIRTA